MSVAETASESAANLPATLPPAAESKSGPGAGASAELTRPWESLRKSAAGEYADIPPIQKAAIILAAIGPEAAGEFLKSMNEHSLTRTAIAISRLERVSKQMLDGVIAEFLLSIGTEEEVSGGNQTARRLLAEVLDDSTIEKIMFDVEGGDARKAWKKLNDIPNTALATFVGSEHPQTAAVILSELRADKAAAVLERLDREFAQIAMLRLAQVPSLDSNVAEMVESVISRDFLSAQQRIKRSRKPADLIAGLMNNLPSDSREKFLTFLEGERPALHGDVLKTMFTFNDIRYRVEAKDVARIVKEIDEGILTVALKWGQAQGNATVEFLLSNLSKRLAERLEEDVAAMHDVSQRDGDGAYQEVVRQIQVMAKAGEIQLIEEEAPED
ncbi:flagellar motor switch protein FliG [Oceanibium sediminis]|uniref:flagellar motor switch protein FliG n=1 Tax=Oceanibium sediminis TaxID=2026339 RepID=UPI000DD4CAB3|nr:FliG C-terminal domain-containing protein [Oceanibium sediminis]